MHAWVTYVTAVVAYALIDNFDLHEAFRDHQYPRTEREANTMNDELIIKRLDTRATVLGTDTPPTFAAAPDGPYKLQKTVDVTHVFD